MKQSLEAQSVPGEGGMLNVIRRVMPHEFVLHGYRVRLSHLAVGVAVVIGLSYGLVAGQATSYIFATAFAMYISVLGASVLIGLSGQVSLGQGAFVAVGAYTTGILSVHWNVSIWLTLPLAAVTGVVMGILVGWPAARLGNVYLVVFTLAFGLGVPEVLQNMVSVTGGGNGLSIAVPTFMQDARYQFLIALGVALICTVIFIVVSRSRFGRRWRGVRDSEPAVMALGWSPAFNKVSAFAFGSGLAAVGGSLLGILVGYVSPDGYSFVLSVYLLLAVVLGGPGTVVGSIIGTGLIVLLPYYTAGVNDPQLLLGAAVVGVFLLVPGGLGNRLMRKASTVNSVSEHIPLLVVKERSDPVRSPGRDGSGVQAASLAVETLTVAYGGGVALADVTLTVAPGEAVAVVGANGAGKSTLLRAISGWVIPRSGQVMVSGMDITARPAYAIARLGIVHVPEGRCVFPDLSVAENLRLGYRPADGATEDELLANVLEIFPTLQDRLVQRSGSLSGGEQQMLAIGRGLMARPTLIMLDEPCLGLAPVIIKSVFAAMEAIRASGVSVLFVEQNVEAALDFADRGYVFARGRCVLDGTASELQASEEIVKAYLV
ncbi:MAG: ABC transporter permease subunit [Ferrimicrobium sp.]